MDSVRSHWPNKTWEEHHGSNRISTEEERHQQATSTHHQQTGTGENQSAEDTFRPENNVWALCRDLLEGGKKPEDIKKQAQVFLMKHTDPQAALKAWTSRLAARAVWRAQRAAKAGKGK